MNTSRCLTNTNLLKPRYIPGTIGCVVCLGIEFFLILAWRTVLSNRNRNRDKRLRELGISEDERKVRAKVLGEQDATDLENLYVRSLTRILASCTNAETYSFAIRCEEQQPAPVPSP